MSEAYAIGNISIKDHEKWLEYRNQVAATLVPWQGAIVFRGKKIAVCAGASPHEDNVIIRFPDQQALNNWFHSDAYQALIPLRELAADVDLIAYQADN